jgi:hypothetical protein
MSLQIVSDAERTSTPMSSAAEQRALHIARVLLLSSASVALASEASAVQSATSERAGLVLTEALSRLSPSSVAQVQAPVDDDFALLLRDIVGGALPTMTAERRALAEAAADANTRRSGEDVETWARRLAEATSNVDD